MESTPQEMLDAQVARLPFAQYDGPAQAVSPTNKPYAELCVRSNSVNGVLWAFSVQLDSIIAMAGNGTIWWRIRPEIAPWTPEDVTGELWQIYARFAVGSA